MDCKDIMHLISHEWLSFRHPDPDAVQLRLMQVVFGKSKTGEARKLFQVEEWDALLMDTLQALLHQTLGQ
eukprot:576720-Amphidinium_carterae.1